MSKPLYTILIPCYNGEKYIRQSLHSIINQKYIDQNITHMYEIIFINDGSTDSSIDVMNRERKKWNSVIRKDFIRVIDKPNGQYGSVINRGIKEAKGIYFKVLDVDDAFHSNAFIKLLYLTASLKKHVDVILTDHTYEKVANDESILQTLAGNIKPNIVQNAKKVRMPKDLITMHSIIYRLDFLKDMNYKQVEGIYYSDSQYSIIPFLRAKTIFYVAVPLYRYFIGRDEQSINLKVMIKNESHQLKVMWTIWDEINLKEVYSPLVLRYAMTTLRQMAHWRILIIARNPAIINKRKAILSLIKEFKVKYPEYYISIINGPFFNWIRISRGFFLPGLMKVAIFIYSKFRKNILSEWD